MESSLNGWPEELGEASIFEDREPASRPAAWFLPQGCAAGSPGKISLPWQFKRETDRKKGRKN